MTSLEESSNNAIASIPLARPKFIQSVNESNKLSGIDVGIKSNQEDTPIFSKRKLTLRMPPQYNGEYMHVTVSRNWLVCIVKSATQQAQIILLRFFLSRALAPNEFQLDKYLSGYKISNLFVDPTGFHILIGLIPQSSGLSADFLYIHGNSSKVRRIEKFKDHEITAVAFNSEYGTESTTGPILLGTSRGIIFETEMAMDNEKPLYKKQVYDLGLGRSKYPITGLEFQRVPNSQQYLIIATTPDSIFTFQDHLRPDDKSLQLIFNKYVSGCLHGSISMKTDLNYSVLNLYKRPNESFAKLWGWLGGSGLKHGEIEENKINSENFLLGEDLIPFDKDIEQRKHLSSEERRLNVPISFVLTEFHAILLYSNHLTAICLLNQQIIYEEYFHERMGKLLNITCDNYTGQIYVYTEKMLFNIKIHKEERNIWQIYLDKGLYDLAEIHAADEDVLNKVLLHKAKAAYSAGDYVRAAEIFADTQETFADICLTFIDLDDKRPLIQYVKRRMEKCPSDHHNKIFPLVIWLIDLYLTQINLPGCLAAEKNEWQAAYDEFLRNFLVIKCLRIHHDDIQKLIIQHADTHNLKQFSVIHKDYELVIEQHLIDEKYLDALQLLIKQDNYNLYYKYCPMLMEHIPQATIEAITTQARKLDIKQLIPTLITINSTLHINEIIKYIEYCIYNLNESNHSVHNYLISLYAEHRPLKLMKYLENEGNDLSLLRYDINYALGICLQFEVKDACIYLYCLLEMWYDAVNLALSYNMKLAKDTASKPKNDEIKRELWLHIAYHEVKGTNDIKKALDLLNECNLIGIEDLLPFFADFEKIDDFKEPICKALKEYNQKMQELQNEMDECTKQADRVRNDLQNLREQCIRIKANDLCDICNVHLLTKAFFAFACCHKFHADCLEKAVLPLLNANIKQRFASLKHQLEETLVTQHAASDEISKQLRNKRKEIKSEIESIIASDCLYCGLMIATIDEPFVVDSCQGDNDWN